MSRKGTYQHRATLKSYAFGVAQDLSGSIADFIAPRVSVGIASGFYKKFGDKTYIGWNFTKFLVDRDGKVIARFEPTVDMKKVREAVEAAL